jgi:hypothetical protein
VRRAAAVLLLLLGILACEGTPDTVSPTVRLVHPLDGDTLEPGEHTLVAVASDDRGVHHLIFWCEGQMLGFFYDPAAETLRCGWDCRAYAGRPVQLQVEALDRELNEAFDQTRVYVSPAR